MHAGRVHAASKPTTASLPFHSYGRAPSRSRWRCRSAWGWPSATSSLSRRRSRSRPGRCCPSLSAPLQVWPGPDEGPLGTACGGGGPGAHPPCPRQCPDGPAAAGHDLCKTRRSPAGLVLEPLPVGAWAFLGVTATILTRTLSFAQAFTAFTNDAIWLIVVSFFFAKASWMIAGRGRGARLGRGHGCEGSMRGRAGWRPQAPPRPPGLGSAAAMPPRPPSFHDVPRCTGLPEDGPGPASGHHLCQVLW